MKLFSSRNIVRILLSIGLFSLSSTAILGQKETDGDLLSKEITLCISKGTFVYALAKIASEYDVPIGWEKALKHFDAEKIEIDFKKTPLKVVLNKLVKQVPEYKWELTNGVINVVPSENRGEFISDLLALSIDAINFAGRRNFSSLRKGILASPEVMLLMNKTGVVHDKIPFDGRLHDPLFSNSSGIESSSGLTVREILNNVIRESASHRTWVVEMVGREQNKFLISL